MADVMSGVYIDNNIGSIFLISVRIPKVCFYINIALLFLETDSNNNKCELIKIFNFVFKFKITSNSLD